jgi:tellurite methyltransferase
VVETEPRPSSWLVRHTHLLPKPTAEWTPCALDLAAGRGRNAFWLATQAGCRTLAIDIDPRTLADLEERARQAGADLETRCQDLEAPDAALDHDAFDVVVVTRYLHRPLFPEIRAALRPGGLLIYETFTAAQARLGKPTNPAFLLEPGELCSLVRPLEVLGEREGLFDGAAIASVVARRPAFVSSSRQS